MANFDPSLTSLGAEIVELRAALAEQRASFMQVIEQQQAAINALQQAAQQPAALTAPQLTVVEADAAPAMGEAPTASAESSAENSDEETASKPKHATSRRGLLRGAAAVTAAAAAATVALSAAQPAHAAPLATGGSFILGNTNDADATTVLTPSPSSAPYPLLQVDNSANLAPAIVGDSQTYFGAVVGVGSNGGTGIWGASDTGSAVIGNSASGIAINAVGAGRIAQNPQGSAGAPTGGSVTYFKGEQIRDSNGELWICLANGAPGTWVRVPHVDVGASGGAITYLSKPIRLLDTRPGAQAAVTPGAKFAPGDHYITTNGVNYSSVTVPGNATGILGNLTVLNATGGGFISLCPANVGFSGTANLAFGAGQIISNAYTTGVGSFIVSLFPLRFATGIDVYVSGSSTDVIVDLFAVVL